MTAHAEPRVDAPAGPGAGRPQAAASCLRATGALPVRTLAVTSGKGGVGKTSVVVNLAIAVARLGHRVALLDADYGLGNIDILLGLDSDRTLEHVLRGAAPLQDVLADGPEGVRILPAASGVQDLTSLTNEQHERLKTGLGELAGSTDLLLVDTATGISDNVVAWLTAATEVLVVTSPDPAALVDAYAVIKLLGRAPRPRPVGLVVNHAADEAEARLVHARLDLVVRRFLSRPLPLRGHVVHDRGFADAVRRRQPLVTLLPDAPASRCFERLARTVATAPDTAWSQPLAPALHP